MFVSIFRGDCNRRAHKIAIGVCRMIRFRYITIVFGWWRRVAARCCQLEIQTTPSPLPREPLFIYLFTFIMVDTSQRALSSTSHWWCDCLFNSTHTLKRFGFFFIRFFIFCSVWTSLLNVGRVCWVHIGMAVFFPLFALPLYFFYQKLSIASTRMHELRATMLMHTATKLSMWSAWTTAGTAAPHIDVSRWWNNLCGMICESIPKFVCESADSEFDNKKFFFFRWSAARICVS